MMYEFFKLEVLNPNNGEMEEIGSYPPEAQAQALSRFDELVTDSGGDKEGATIVLSYYRFGR